MRLGLFGGSFNPPHVAHTMAALYALETGGVDRVLVVPCADHPFGKGLAPFADRLKMCRLAFARLGEAVEVSDIEARRNAPSYTIDTVRELRRLRPDDEIRLIVGSDILDELDRWKDAGELRRMVELFVVPRAADRAGETYPKFQDGASGGEYVPFSLPAISSSQLRERLARGESADGLIARDVLKFIRDHRLYTII